MSRLIAYPAENQLKLSLLLPINEQIRVDTFGPQVVGAAHGLQTNQHDEYHLQASMSAIYDEMMLIPEQLKLPALPKKIKPKHAPRGFSKSKASSDDSGSRRQSHISDIRSDLAKRLKTRIELKEVARHSQAITSPTTLFSPTHTESIEDFAKGSSTAMTDTDWNKSPDVSPTSAHSNTEFMLPRQQIQQPHMQQPVYNYDSSSGYEQSIEQSFLFDDGQGGFLSFPELPPPNDIPPIKVTDVGMQYDEDVDPWLSFNTAFLEARNTR